MKPMESFLMMYYILEQCYWQCKEDGLGGFLSSISPEFWADGMPMDKAIMDDWHEFIAPKNVNHENIVKTVYDFMDYYEGFWGFGFSETKRWLSMVDDAEVVKTAVAKTSEMYETYHYKN